MGRLLSDQEKETKHLEELAKAREIESNAELQEARKKLIDASCFTKFDALVPSYL